MTARRCANGFPSRSSRTTASTSPSPPTIRPSVTARDVGALALDQSRHRLVDRVGGEQVPGGDGVALADPVAAVLGLVVHGRRPLELEEGDVRGTGQRDPLAGDAGGARRSAAVRRDAGTRRSRLARHATSRRRPGAVRRGSAPAPPGAPRRGGRTRPAARRTRGSRGSTRARRRASRGRPGAAACRAAPGARPAASPRSWRSSSVRSSGCARSHSITSRSASRYSASFVSATGTTTWRLPGSCGSTSAFKRRTKQRRRRCQCRRSSLSCAAELLREARAGAEILEAPDHA